MHSKRIAVFAGTIGVLSAVVEIVPGVLLGSLFERGLEQGLPGWLPAFGTIGQTATLYTYGTDIIGALLMIVFAVGFGYYASQQIKLRYEYRRFFGAVVAGTTIPLIAAWMVGVGAFIFGVFSVFNTLIVAMLVLRLFATVSLPVIVGIFTGAALTHLSNNEYTSPESDEANTDVRPTRS